VSDPDRHPAVSCSADGEPARAAPLLEALPARELDLGDGTAVRRLLPHRRRRTIGAWCFLDHFGPHDVSAGPGMQVGPHPHTGLQTVTWLLEGEVLHRDSLGNEQQIRPGELNLMTAGRGIAHAEESPVPHPPRLHGVQLWVAQPAEDSAGAPAFEHHAELPRLSWGALSATVIAGSAAGAPPSPAHAVPGIVALEVTAPAGGSGSLPLDPGFEHGVAVLDGGATLAGAEIAPGMFCYLGAGRYGLEVSAGPDGLRLLLIGGEPLTEAIVVWWNFVGRSTEEIAGARADWEAGLRFGEVRGAGAPRIAAPPMPPGRLRSTTGTVGTPPPGLA